MNPPGRAAGRSPHGAVAMGLLDVELPYPPTVNTYWRRAGSRMHISHAGRRYRERVAKVLADRGVEAIAGQLAVEVDVYPPDRRRRDLDNVQKALLDALAHGGAYADDCQVDKLTITRMQMVKDGKVVVRIRRTT